jgi:hypothetical protein
MPMSEGLSLMVSVRGVGAEVGAGATIAADADELEDVGTMDPAMDDRTDVPLEGGTVADDPWWVIRDKPHWVRM